MIYENCPIVVMGIDIDSDFLMEIQKKNTLIGFLDDSHNGEEYKNYPVFGWSFFLQIKEKIKIIILGDQWQIKDMIEMNSYFASMGYTFANDYIYEWMLKAYVNFSMLYQVVNQNSKIFSEIVDILLKGRQLVAIHGNCQTHCLMRLLSTNQEFVSKYLICELPKLWEEEIMEYKMLEESGIWEKVDILFSQIVKKDVKFGEMVSTEYIKKLISEKCKVIIITNLYFLGYFPQLKKIPPSVDGGLLKGEILYSSGFIDINIKEMLDKDFQENDIINELTKSNFYNLEQLEQVCTESLEEIKKREENCDIIMSDFIEFNYKKELLFVIENHPTACVLIEFAKRILDYIKVDDKEIKWDGNEIQLPCPQNVRTIIYPSVLKGMGFGKKYENQIYSFFLNLKLSELKYVYGINPDIDYAIKPYIENANEESELRYKLEIPVKFKEYIKLYSRLFHTVNLKTRI